MAEERDITPSNVYGDVWVASSGFTKEEEEDIERSYYYEDNESSNEDDEESCSVNEVMKSEAKQKGDPSDDGDTSAWSEYSSVEDSEMDMNIDDYEEEDDSVLAGYRFGREDIVAHYNHFPDPNNLNGEEEVGGDEGHDA